MKYLLPLLAVLLLLSCKKDKDEPNIVAPAFALYTRNAGDSLDLWYSREDGSSFGRVLDKGVGKGQSNSPAWSSDGRTIFYTINTTRPNENGIYSIKPNGTDPKKLFVDDETQVRNFYQLVTSKDNQRVVFSYSIPRNGRKVIELYSMCPCGTQVNRMTNFETSGPSPVSTEAYAGSFNKSSTKLYFTQSFPSSNGTSIVDIYEMDMADKSSKKLTTVNAQNAADCVPSISPNGERIVFSVDNTIHIMNNDGSNLTRLGMIKGFRPQWGPNNKDIYFASNGISSMAEGIYKTDVTASVPVRVFGNAAAGKFEGFVINF